MATQAKLSISQVTPFLEFYFNTFNVTLIIIGIMVMKMLITIPLAMIFFLEIEEKCKQVWLGRTSN